MMGMDYAKEVILTEAKTLQDLAGRLTRDFEQAVDLILKCQGRVVVSGMGKAGIIGQKISATLASTGTPSLWLHPAEARHGDLGRVTKDDVVLILSNSGQTDEISDDEIGLWDLLLKSGRRLSPSLGRASPPWANTAMWFLIWEK
jgi:arabinose-5-phosphate isomerase